MIAGRDILARNRNRNRGRRSSRQRRYNPRERERTPMLNLNRITMFRYGIRDIMSSYEIDKAVATTVIASVVAKGSRISIDSAKVFVRGQEKTGSYPTEAADEICDLLEKFSKFR